MYNLVDEAIVKLSPTERLIVLTYEVQDGAGSTIQRSSLLATVPEENESDDSSEERKKEAEAPWS